MSLALMSLSNQGAVIAKVIQQKLGTGDLYWHVDVDPAFEGQRFERVAKLTSRIFTQYRGLIFVMPCGVVVRSIAPLLQHKKRDPAVVMVDVGGRFAVSLLSGHEGGANDLTIDVANAIDAEPVISTTTQAIKTIIVGVGCRRGTESHRIVKAIKQTLVMAEVSLEQVRLIASADIKSDEAGLIEAADELGIPLRLIASREICACKREFTESKFVKEQVGLPAVAEPVALLAGRKTQLIQQRQTFSGITTAVARENCLWLDWAPEALMTEPTEQKKPSPPAV